MSAFHVCVLHTHSVYWQHGRLRSKVGWKELIINYLTNNNCAPAFVESENIWKNRTWLSRCGKYWQHYYWTLKFIEYVRNDLSARYQSLYGYLGHWTGMVGGFVPVMYLEVQVEPLPDPGISVKQKRCLKYMFLDILRLCLLASK